MRRKIIKLAEKTLVVSLPAKWVNTQNLQKGDELEVEPLNDKLLLIPPKKSGAEKSTISIDVRGVAERVLRWEVSSLHKQGWDEIVIMNYTPEQQKIVEDLISNLFIGFMVMEKSSLRIVVGEVAAIDVNEFDATLRRAFRLLNTQAEELIEAFEKKDSVLLTEQIAHEANNNKLTNFCERLLNKTLTQKSKGHFWYVFAWNLEKVSDNFKYIANYYHDAMIDISPETKVILEDMKNYIAGYYDAIYDFKFEKLTKLSVLKRNLEKQIKQQLVTDGLRHEGVLLSYLHMIVLQMADFSASLIALKFDGDE